MRRSLLLAALCAAVPLAGCYHVTVDTGRTPNGVTISQPFALGFVYGIVPPPTVETMAKCPNGVATVETQQSIVNALVGALTLGILTPMQVDVACAGGTADAGSSPDADLAIVVGQDDSAVLAVAEAADRSAETGEPVQVRFE